MAVYLSSHSTEIHGFDRLSRSLSIASDHRINNADEDDHPRQFDDTVPLDSPLVDENLGNLDLDTEALDDSDCDDRRRKNGPAFEHEQEEMVLDSEDEEINGSRLVVMTKSPLGSYVGKRTKLEDTDSNALVYEQHCAGKGVILTDFAHEKDWAECDGEIARLNGNISIREVEEWSQVDALGFVDHFVSINEVDLSQGIGYRKTFKDRSPIVSGANGPQNLARKINMHTQVKGNGIFEWVDSEEMVSSRKGIISPSDFGGCEQKGVSNLNEETRVGSDRLGSGFAMRSAKDGNKVKKVYEASTVSELELTEKHPEVDAIVRNTFDSYDVGFDTQIAAEAIEALAYARPLGYSYVDACPEMDKKANKSLSGLTEDNSQLNHTSAQTSVCDDRGDTLGSAKRKKRSEGKFGRCISSSSKRQCGNQELDHELTKLGLVQTSKLIAETQLYCGTSNLNESSSISLPKPIEQSKERKFEKSSITISRNNMIPLTTVETSPLADVRFKGQLEKISPLTQQTGHQGSGIWLKTIDDQASYRTEKMSGNMEHGIIVYRRKRSRVNSKPLRVSTIEGSPKLCDSSEEARTSNLTRLSKLGMWNYPRGKRTRRNARNDFNRASDFNAPLSPHCRKECGRSITSTIPMGLGCASLAVCAEKNHFSTESADETADMSCAKRATLFSEIGKSIVSSNYKNHKRPHNKDETKTPLLKELISLGFSEHIPVFEWKELRRRKDIANVRVLFSQHLEEDIVKHQKKVATKLGIAIASCSTDATHFVAEKFARTKNMLEAIALGKPVVTYMWLESCGQANCLIDERNYILRDYKKEKEFGFCMPVSLARANQHPLLKGRRVFITPNIKPNKEIVMNLVKTAHGQLVGKVQTSALKDKDVPEDLLILSCKEDYSICVPFLQKGATVYSSELLLNGIVTQKLEYKRYQLFKIDVNRNCS